MRELIKTSIAIAFILTSFFIGKSIEEEKQSRLTVQLNAKLKISEQTILESNKKIKELRQIVADYKKEQSKAEPTLIKLKKFSFKLN